MDSYAGRATGIGIRPDARQCSIRCSEYNVRIVFNRIYHICGECALNINTLKDCPKQNPYPDRVKKKKSKSQTKLEFNAIIKRSEIIKDARTYQTYESKIEDLTEKYDSKIKRKNK